MARTLGKSAQHINKPGQVPSGSSSFRCVRVPGYTWSLPTLQGQTVDLGLLESQPLPPAAPALGPGPAECVVGTLDLEDDG